MAAQQSAPTEETLAHVNQFLDYMWIHPDAEIRYRASVLNVHSDASYLSAPKAPLKTNKLIYWIKSLLRYSYWISDAIFLL